MLHLVVFLSGAVLMALEMIGSRILAPTFGSSIYIWGALIIVVMTALTLGYYLGGRYADKFPNFLMMAIILTGAGVWVGWLPFWSTPVSYFCAGFGPRIGSMMATMAFFFIPSVLMAMVSPFAIKLVSSSLSNIGNTAGRLSAVSSAGSIIGTLLTSFFLIPIMGVRSIIFTLGFILLGLALFIIADIRRNVAASESLPGKETSKRINRLLMTLIIINLILLVFFSIILPRNSSRFYEQSQILFDGDSLYHHIMVAENGTIRNLHFDNSYQSAMDLEEPLKMVFDYTSYLHLGVVACPNPERVLFIGLGGGSAPKKFLHDYPSLKSIDAVEIDPKVAEVAYEFFELPDDPKLQVLVRDGRLFISQKAREIAAGLALPYDMIIIDAYSESTIPYHLTTIEFLETTRSILTPNGVVVSNIIGALSGPKSRLLYSMTRTFKNVFPQTYLFPVGSWPGESDQLERNVILVSTMNQKYWNKAAWYERTWEFQKEGLVKEDVSKYSESLISKTLTMEMIRQYKVPVLTDDYAPVDTLQHPLL